MPKRFACDSSAVNSLMAAHHVLTLGISRLSRIPDAGWPMRSDCQKAVTAEQKAAGARIIKEYREAIARGVREAGAQRVE